MLSKAALQEVVCFFLKNQSTLCCFQNYIPAWFCYQYW